MSLFKLILKGFTELRVTAKFVAKVVDTSWNWGHVTSINCVAIARSVSES